jgi:hypothetical protein
MGRLTEISPLTFYGLRLEQKKTLWYAYIHVA